MAKKNKKAKKGFTLVELLAVIVVLAIILVIAGYSILKNINDSKEKAKFMAAKDIVSIAIAYIEENESVLPGTNETRGVRVKDMIDNDFLEKNVTNPKTGKNSNIVETDENGVSSKPHEIKEDQVVVVYDSSEQSDYKIHECSINKNTYECYQFYGYAYIFNYVNK